MQDTLAPQIYSKWPCREWKRGRPQKRFFKMIHVGHIAATVVQPKGDNCDCIDHCRKLIDLCHRISLRLDPQVPEVIYTNGQDDMIMQLRRNMLKSQKFLQGNTTPALHVINTQICHLSKGRLRTSTPSFPSQRISALLFAPWLGQCHSRLNRMAAMSQQRSSCATRSY